MSETDESEDEQPQVLYPQSGPGPEEMANDYLPESDDWEAKTVLDTRDPGAVAALSQLGTIYPEVKDLQPMVDDATQHFFKSRTSVAGRSREEYAAILKSMFGGTAEDEVRKWADVFGGSDD